MNESLMAATVQESITSTGLPNQQTPEYWTLDFMMILRILWYIFCLAKVVSIAFFSRPKPSIQERVLRKFLISHNQLIRSFTDDDKKSMQQILTNTIKNASSIIQTQNSKIRKSNKRVNFQVEKNSYYEPREWKQLEPIFYDVIATVESPIKLNPTDSFQQKKHDQEYIEREDLLGLNEKSEELQDQKNNQEDTLPLQSHIRERKNQEEEECDEEEGLLS